jgi:hypothetical protein
VDETLHLAMAANELDWKQIAICSASTGDPSRYLELYEYVGTKDISTAVEELQSHDVFKRVLERYPQREQEVLSRLPYAPDPPPNRDFIEVHHLLHVRLTVREGQLERFSTDMKALIPTFLKGGGWHLVAAGMGLRPPFQVTHLWVLKNANTLDSVMGMLGETGGYDWINENTVQHQDLMHGLGPRCDPNPDCRCPKEIP